MSDLTQLPDGSWVEHPPPSHCPNPQCGTVWDDSGDTVLVGFEFGRTFTCRACQHVVRRSGRSEPVRWDMSPGRTQV